MSNDVRQVVELMSKLTDEEKCQVMAEFWQHDEDMDGQLVFYTDCDGAEVFDYYM